MTHDWPLRCPVCAEPATTAQDPPPAAHDGDEPVPSARILGIACTSGHRFDAARQGYVNLLAGRGTRFTPDSAEMVMARERVQSNGIFDEVASALVDAAGPATAGASRRILEVGCGTGYYLHRLLAADPQARGVGMDLSPAALKRAARHPRTLALGWDVWRELPLEGATADIVLAVFAPRNAEEFHRVLAPGGRLLVVTPRSGHLAELAGFGLLDIGHQKAQEVEHQLVGPLSGPLSRLPVRVSRELGRDTAADLILMGPAGHHRSREQVLEALPEPGALTVTIDVEVSIFENP